MIMKFHISKLMELMSWVIRHRMRIAMVIAIAFVVAGIGYYVWTFAKFFLIALVLCVIGAIVSSGGPEYDVDDDY